eukprot:5495121-Pleurochrysis_carterae.AAC.1
MAWAWRPRRGSTRLAADGQPQCSQWEHMRAHPDSSRTLRVKADQQDSRVACRAVGALKTQGCL